MSEQQPPTQWAITFSASGTVGTSDNQSEDGNK